MKFGPRLAPFFWGLFAFAILIAPGCLIAGAQAESLSDASVLEATVPVTAQSADELRRAAAIGLADVLVGASGRAEVVTQSAVRAALASADRYVEQYRYERQPAPENTLVLKLKFAQATVEGLLRSSLPATAVASRQTLILTATGVDTFPEYTQLLTYLSRVAGVRAALPQLISGDAVSVQLRFDGVFEQLTRQLALDHRLLPEAAPVDAASAVNTAGSTTELRYRWQGG